MTVTKAWVGVIKCVVGLFTIALVVMSVAVEMTS